MGIKIKNLQTGEFEKFNIPALKGEKGEPGEIEPSEKVDYIGKQHSKLRDTMNANVDYIIKTAIGEFNYLDYEGQYITATDTIEGRSKSAILKGQTLVNVDSYYDKTYFNQSNIDSISEDGYIQVSATGGYRNVYTYISSLIKPSTQYLFIIEIKENTLDGSFFILTDGNPSSCFGGSFTQTITSKTTGLFKYKVTTINDLTNCQLCLRNFVDSSATSGKIVFRTMLIEYQEGMENLDIPFFRGMQSVKMPVLTTTGKNLFDGEFTKINGLYGVYSINDGTHTYSLTDNDTSVDLSNTSFGDWDGKNKNTINWASKHNDIYATKRTIVNRHLVFYPNNEETFNKIKQRFNIQIEQGSIATSYEPHKSNILTCNEEVELRSVDNVQDEMDCLTGEVVERVAEVIFDGSDDENWELLDSPLDNNISFKILLAVPTSSYAKCISNKFNDIGSSMANKTIDGISISNSGKYFCLKISVELVNSIDSLKSYLSQNPLTVQYQLATKSIKTVDLSDNHVYSYEGTTHYTCSSEDGSLVPTLSVKIPTDTQLTIKEQKATTQTLLIKNMDLQQSIKEVQAMNLAFNTALYNSFNSIREEVEDIKKHVSTNENLEGSF